LILGHAPSRRWVRLRKKSHQEKGELEARRLRTRSSRPQQTVTGDKVLLDDVDRILIHRDLPGAILLGRSVIP